VKYLLLFLILILTTISGGAVLYHPYTIEPTFPMVYLNWTVINLDKTLTSDEINTMLLRYNVTVAGVIDGYDNRNELCIDDWLQDPGLFNKNGFVMVPYGRENFTVTIINERDPSVKDRISNVLGSSWDLRCQLIHLSTDTDCDLVMRILHEIGHGKKLDSDGLYRESGREFNQWMYDTNYKFKDYFTVNERIYQNILGKYRIGRGQQVNLDYLFWLMNVNNNVY
jgi:hypothetical protein